MKKSDIKILPEFYDSYINLTQDIELNSVLENFGANLLHNIKDKLVEAGDKVYAPGKWTVKEIIQHLIDSERVFSYRALRFARNDKTVLPGYEENDFAKESIAGRRSIDDLLNEFEIVRKSSLILFKSFNDEMLLREGVCFNKNISVLAIGFVLGGHTIHHVNVIKEKYLNL